MSGKAASKKSGKSNAGAAAPSKPSLKVAANATPPSVATQRTQAKARPPHTVLAVERTAQPTPACRVWANKQPTPACRVCGYTKKTIALVYDFDGTLSPRPMQEYSFLPQLGITAADFWAECTRVARERQADPLITYMHLMYKKAKEKGLVVDRAALVAQGASVELYPGVTDWFAAIGDYVRLRAETPGIELRHYLISSGLTEIIEGTVIAPHFHNVFASEYWFEPYETPFPKRVITDTGKTQYLFRINKGIEDLGESINRHMPEAERPIPWSNMIYFGDGETDVPSMALMKKSGGAALRSTTRTCRRRCARSYSTPAASTSTPPPTTAAAATCSSGPACSSTASSPTSACGKRSGGWGGSVCPPRPLTSHPSFT